MIEDYKDSAETSDSQDDVMEQAEEKIEQSQDSPTVELDESALQNDVEPLDRLEQEQSETTQQPQQNEQAVPEQNVDVTVESVIEAVLFASDEPLTAVRLANIVDSDARHVRQHIDTLNEKYTANNNAFRIEQIAGGYQMLTLSPYNNWLKKLLRERDEGKLSAAALETLAIIAYKQPVIRADIEAIRGVASGEVIRSLMYKGLVKIVGRAEVLGRPMLYGTTKKFLETFGLNTLKDLPKVEELKKAAKQETVNEPMEPTPEPAPVQEDSPTIADEQPPEAQS